MIANLPNPSPGEPIKASHIRQLATMIRRLMPMSSPTVRVQETANGIAFHTLPGGGAGGSSLKYAWRPTLSRQEGTTDYITIEPGYVVVHDDSLFPTVNGSSIYNNPRPELALTSAAVAKWVYLKVGYTLNLVEGFVVGATADSAVIQAFSSVQTSDNAYLYIPLFIWQRGYPTIQWRHLNVSAWARDNGTGSGVARWAVYGI